MLSINVVTQELFSATPEDLEWCWNADIGAAVLLQVCNRGRPGRADVSLSEEHVPGTTADRGRPSGKDASLW